MEALVRDSSRVRPCWHHLGEGTGQCQYGRFVESCRWRVSHALSSQHAFVLLTVTLSQADGWRYNSIAATRNLPSQCSSRSRHASVGPPLSTNGVPQRSGHCGLAQTVMTIKVMARKRASLGIFDDQSLESQGHGFKQL